MENGYWRTRPKEFVTGQEKWPHALVNVFFSLHKKLRLQQQGLCRSCWSFLISRKHFSINLTPDLTHYHKQQEIMMAAFGILFLILSIVLLAVGVYLLFKKHESAIIFNLCAIILSQSASMCFHYASHH